MLISVGARAFRLTPRGALSCFVACLLSSRLDLSGPCRLVCFVVCTSVLFSSVGLVVRFPFFASDQATLGISADIGKTHREGPNPAKDREGPNPAKERAAKLLEREA